MKWVQKHHVILIIMSVAAALRFWRWPWLQYHHDELSALLRTRFPAFDQLIDRGVTIDGHPAFTQVFLWLYTQVVGFEPMWIKLPFVLAGILSVLLIYLVARELFSRKAANVAASMMAVLQYGLIYSQWARPYAFGLLFMLIAAYAILRYRSSDDRRYLIGFALGAALTAYTHYFALLQVIVLTALVFAFWLTKKQRLEVTVAALVSFILWAPHINITLHHLAIGGIGDWLKQPSEDFWLELLTFSFHYSWWLALPLLSAAAISLLKAGRSAERMKIQVGLIALWLIPYLITYFYSLSVSSLMHHGTMYFTFPMLVLFTSSFFERLNKGFAKFAGTWVMIVGTVTLVTQRHHFSLNTVTEFHDPVQWYHHMSRSGESDVSALFDLREDAVHLLDSKGIENYDEVRLIDPIWKSGQLGRYLSQLETRLLMITVTAGSEPEYLALAMHYYPIVEELHCYQTSSCFLLKKREDNDPNDIIGRQVIDKQMAGEEYSQALHLNIARRTGTNTLILGAELNGMLPSEAKLVMDWKSNDSTQFWRAVDIEKFQTAHANLNSFACVSIDIRDIDDAYVGGKMSTYLWNPRKQPFYVNRLIVRQSASNPIRYGLFNPIPVDNSLTIDHGIAKKLAFFEED